MKDKKHIGTAALGGTVPSEASSDTRPSFVTRKSKVFFDKLMTLGLLVDTWYAPAGEGAPRAINPHEWFFLRNCLSVPAESPSASDWIVLTDMFSFENPSLISCNKVWGIDRNPLLGAHSQMSASAWCRFPHLGSHDIDKVRASDYEKYYTYVDRHFLRAVSGAEPSTGTASREERKEKKPSADKRIATILATAELEPTEQGDESPFEREIASYVTEYGSPALTAIYRVLFESEEWSADQGAALLEALALLPKRMEFNGRSSIFRAGLHHPEHVIRFVAARALARLRGPGSLDALRAAAGREKHPDLSRNLTEILRVLDAAQSSAA